MLFSSQKNIDDIIAELLLEGPCTIKSIHAHIRTHTKPVTLRAVYKTINHLLAARVVIKVGKNIMLNKEWAQTVVNKLTQTSSIPRLSIGESITYTLTSPSHIDTYWKTIFSSLPTISDKEPPFFYNPHDFWIFVPDRKESEKTFYRSFAEEQKYGFFTIGGADKLDAHFKKTYRSNYLKINLESIDVFKRTDHVTVWGPYIISVKLPLHIAKRIDHLYQRNDVNTLTSLLQTKFKVKIKIEHKPNKADKLRTRLSKNFYIPVTVSKNY